jgi:TolB-like protein/tetratricopeptide (TPR) repeat protein
MSQPGSAKAFSAYRFGVFQFHAGTLELAKNGSAIRLQPQPARLLNLLLMNAGGLVTRGTIRELLWKDGTNVDFETGVNRCIRQLRTALCDDAVTPRYIKTAARIGYSFIAPVAGGLTTPAATPEFSHRAPANSIAVLPFANLSGDPQDEYFSDGLTEEITNVLAQITGLRVLARTSAFAFKGKNDDIRRIAATLDVDNVLEGSVRRSGGQIRVTVQLIEAGTGTHLSSKRYDGQMADIFALQDEIAADVARQFHVEFAVPRRSTFNVAANEAYLEGRFHWQRYAPGAFTKALACFERAVAMDSACAPAWSGIAQCCLGLVTEAGLPALDYLPKAAEAARHALELDDRSAESHACLGQVAAMLYYDWPSAARHFRRALALNPSTYVRLMYSGWHLFPLGRAKDALLETGRIVADEPLNLIGRWAYGATFFFARDFDRAAEEWSRLLDIEPSFSKALQALSVARGMQGKFVEGISLAQKLVEILGHTVHSLWALAQAYAVAGETGAARRALRDLEELQGGDKGAPTQMAVVYGLLGEADRAFACLEEAYRYRQPLLLLANVQPRMDCLRSDPRFHAILARLNLLKPGIA